MRLTETDQVICFSQSHGLLTARYKFFCRFGAIDRHICRTLDAFIRFPFLYAALATLGEAYSYILDNLVVQVGHVCVYFS